jgi:hypothetical protein
MGSNSSSRRKRWQSQVTCKQQCRVCSHWQALQHELWSVCTAESTACQWLVLHTKHRPVCFYGSMSEMLSCAAT